VPVFENNTEEQKARFMMVLRDECVVEGGRTFIPCTVQSPETVMLLVVFCVDVKRDFLEGKIV
jgi:hypothetical protein